MPRTSVARAGDLVGVAALAVPAVALLWWPQFGDQALFGQGGRVLAAGGVYWRDFWDVKQPGIFWLYALGERLGRGVLGVRVLELVAVLVAGVVVVVLCRDWGLRPVVRGLAPVVVLAPYLLSGDANGVGQVEGLMTLPMLLGYLAVTRAARAQRRGAVVAWACLAGACTGVVAVLKLLYAPLGLVLLVAALVEHRGTAARRDRWALIAAWSVGSAVPVGAVVGYAAAHGVLPLAVYSTFTAPREELATGLVSVAELLTMARALLLATTFVGPLALLAVSGAARARRVAREGGLVAWVLGAAAFAAPQLPTTYRVLVVLPPVGLLAVLGLERLLAAASRRPAGVRLAGTAVVAVLVVPLLPGVVRLGEAGAAEGWSLSDGARLAVGDRIGGSPMVEPAGVMRGDVRSGSAIYVLGDPVVYRVLGARQAIEMNGWGPEIMSDRMWDEVVRELDRSRPEWVFVQEEYQQYVGRRPALLGLLGAAYRPVESAGAGGRWWRTDEPGRPVPSPEGNQLAVNRR